MMGNFHMSSLVDNILLMNWIEIGDAFRLGLTVAKMRANPNGRATHEREIINGEGMRVMPLAIPAPLTRPFSSYLNLISRNPTRLPEPDPTWTDGSVGCRSVRCRGLDARAGELRGRDQAQRHHVQPGRADRLHLSPPTSRRSISRRSNWSTGRIADAEALIRWNHPDRGLLNPIQFVPIAEDTGLIVPIGRWVLHEACRQAKSWQLAGLRPIPISVNVSAIEFRSSAFVSDIVDILKETCLEPRYLELELTESVLMAQVQATNAVLHDLKQLGVHLAIDDFGTGWSSLSYLRNFPIDALKIDKSFVQEITAPSQEAPIVRAVIQMAKSLKQLVIAEGVETHDQLVWLKTEGCDEGQGYYFSRPVIPSRFGRLLESSA